jgi:hypothetical protein
MIVAKTSLILGVKLDLSDGKISTIMGFALIILIINQITFRLKDLFLKKVFPNDLK